MKKSTKYTPIISGLVATPLLVSTTTPYAVAQTETANDTVCIGDQVWLDENENGLQDDDPLRGVKGVYGVKVKLFEESGYGTRLFREVTTDREGKWEMCDIPKGNYRLTFDYPTSIFDPTIANVGSDNEKNSRKRNYTYTIDSNSTAYDFGLVRRGPTRVTSTQYTTSNVTTTQTEMVTVTEYVTYAPITRTKYVQPVELTSVQNTVTVDETLTETITPNPVTTTNPAETITTVQTITPEPTTVNETPSKETVTETQENVSETVTETLTSTTTETTTLPQVVETITLTPQQNQTVITETATTPTVTFTPEQETVTETTQAPQTITKTPEPEHPTETEKTTQETITEQDTTETSESTTTINNVPASAPSKPGLAKTGVNGYGYLILGGLVATIGAFATRKKGNK